MNKKTELYECYVCESKKNPMSIYLGRYICDNCLINMRFPSPASFVNYMEQKVWPLGLKMWDLYNRWSEKEFKTIKDSIRKHAQK